MRVTTDEHDGYAAPGRAPGSDDRLVWGDTLRPPSCDCGYPTDAGQCDCHRQQNRDHPTQQSVDGSYHTTRHAQRMQDPEYRDSYQEATTHIKIVAAAREAVRALVPVLPLTGSPKSGYRYADVRGRGTLQEIERAANAVANLHRVLSEAS